MVEPLEEGGWKRLSDGHIFIRKELPVGAMWWATWFMGDDGKPMSNFWDNATEVPLIVLTPGGDWNIDSRASNCTKPNDRLHRCWCRHGIPPEITVDKNGLTCNAGAGSIQCGSYHGFLKNGFLT